jgi:plasmid stabilization system protein ParE
MKYRLIVHDRVREDIRRNRDWWAEHHSEAQAQRWFDLAFASLEKLETFPESRPLSYENDDFPIEIRDLPFGFGSRPSYRAVFTIKDDAVHVLAVRRCSEDVLTPRDVDVTQ